MGAHRYSSVAPLRFWPALSGPHQLTTVASVSSVGDARLAGVVWMRLTGEICPAGWSGAMQYSVIKLWRRVSVLGAQLLEYR